MQVVVRCRVILKVSAYAAGGGYGATSRRKLYERRRMSSLMKETAHAPALCARFHYASELIGRRWNGAIIFMLLKQTCRFATLRDGIPDITDRMLSERLHELEHEGVVERVVVPDTPVRVEYSLTKKGRALAGAIDSIANWAEKYIAAPAGRKPKKIVRAAKSAVR